MDRHPSSGAVGRGLAGLVLVCLGLTGCGATGTDGTSTGTTVESSGPVTQSTTLPADWPAGVTLPVGATVSYTTSTDEGMSALFSAPQDLATLRQWFEEVATELGYERISDESFVGMLSTSWSDGDVTISVIATPASGRTSGLLLVEPTG